MPDFGKSRAWEDGHFENFNRFRQGHIIEDVPLLYIGTSESSLWLADTEVVRDGFGQDLQVMMEKGLPLRHALITSQGCDIVKRTHPWIGVVPVYDAALRCDRGKLGQIRAGGIKYLLPLLPPWGSAEQKWVADLRVEFSVEKTVLLDREPLAAYSDEVDYIRVGQRLAHLRQRPDVAETCLQNISQPLFDWVREQDEETRERMWASVDHVRLWQDSHEVPSQARLYLVLRDGGLDVHEHENWDAAHEYVYERATLAGMTLLPVKVETLQSLSAHEFLASSQVEDGESS